jgi:hypothetical protein
MTTIPTLETGAAVGIIGLAVVQSMSMYRDAAPSLEECRRSSPGDYRTRQHLMDADIYGGIAVAVIGGSAAVLTRSWVPLVLGSLGLIMLSSWSRMVLNSANAGMIPTPPNMTDAANATDDYTP